MNTHRPDPGRRCLAIGLLATIGCAKPATPTSAPTARPPVVASPEGMVDASVAALAEIGIVVAEEEFTITTVSEAEALAEMAEQTDAMWPGDRPERIYGLLWLLMGNTVLAVDPGVVRQGLTVGAAQPTVAYYRPKRVTFIDKETAKIVPRDLILGHELVHAYQDQQLGGGLFPRLAAATTVDALNAVQLAIEGHAQFMAMSAFLRARGIEQGAIPASLFDAGSTRISSPGMALLYEQGALAMLALHRSAGPAAVDRLWREPPPSSEQMLHPSKLGIDRPTVIEAPSVPGATRRWDDTIGEMTIRVMLGQHVPDDTGPVVAAMGWDGDRLAWFDTQSGPALVWRTVWDRDVDAEQFVNAVKAVPTLSDTAHVTAHGTSVDVVVTAPPATLADARRIAEALPPAPRPDPEGAESTAIAEREYLADIAARAKIDRGALVVRDTGVRIPIPNGWQALRIQGAPVIRAPLVDGFGDNIIINTHPNLLGFTLDVVEAESLAQLRDVLGAEIIDHRRKRIAGRDAWIVETLGHEAGSTVELHQLIVVFFTETHRVVIVASARPDRWPTIGPIMKNVIDGMQPAGP